jgi:superfamily II DNA/RNA helicase
VQSAAIPAALSGNHVFLTAQTGSGKTLGYVLPLLEILLRDRKREPEASAALRPQSQALVVVPTRELALQVQRVWAGFTPVTGLVCARLAPQALHRTANVAAWVTPAVDAPEGVAALWGQIPGLRYLVLDEADALFAMQRNQQLAALPLRRLQDGQLWFSAATVTRNLLAEAEHLARTLSPHRRMVIARDDGLNRPPAAARVHFVQVEYPPEKVTRLLSVLRGDKDGLLRDGKTSLVFCNSIPACRFVQHTLHENGILALACHSGLSLRLREAALERFASGAADVLVCSDLVARGIDWPFVRRVICFDAPLTYHHFLHRIGRLRQGGDCTILLRRARREQSLATFINDRLTQRAVSS